MLKRYYRSFFEFENKLGAAREDREIPRVEAY